MIQRAGLGVAYHAKPIVAAAAGASVTHGDLTALLYLQGYSDEEIVEGGVGGAWRHLRIGVMGNRRKGDATWRRSRWRRRSGSAFI